VFHEFSARHRNFRQALERNFEHISGRVPRGLTLTAEQRLLLGAYVTCEYSVEAAATLTRKAWTRGHCDSS
jgi:hypothetical protein